MHEFLRLLWGTVVYRPYVYAFFICFLVFAFRHLKATGTLVYLALAYLIAFASEYSSTRNGFPFGIYAYFEETRTRELWLSNIPFWDSLSFVFLSYFSWIVAANVLCPGSNAGALDRRAPWLAGLLMMLLDVVIDPLTLMGDRWFLGRIYWYPHGGTYFGVTLANFAGWYFVGFLIVSVIQGLARLGWGFAPIEWGAITKKFGWAALGVYAGVFLMNWGITLWLREWPLALASAVVVALTLGICAFYMRRRRSGVPR